MLYDGGGRRQEALGQAVGVPSRRVHGTTTSLTWEAHAVPYAGGGRRQEALGQAGRFLFQACPAASGGDGDGRPGFFYAGREHAAIAPMREKYTATYPASNGEGDRAAVYSGADSLRLRPRLAGRPVNVTSLEHERWEAGAPRVLSPDGDQLGFRSYTQGWLLLQSPPTH